MAYDAIIIGAGMSGFAAGIRLAMFGKRVVILERHNIPGGLNSYYHKKKRPFDVGLHAMTNFVRKGTKGAPLTKLCRQLRIPWEALELCEQSCSEVRFPGVTLRFSNDFEVFRQSVHAAFPAARDGFERLVAFVDGYDELSLDKPQAPARPVLSELVGDPTLVDMILCPLMLYGSAVEDDMELGQFCVMFKSIFKEGFARPEGGVRTVVKLLRDRFAEHGGEVRFKRGVKRILTRPDPGGGPSRTWGVVLEKDDEVVEAPVVLSSAGLHETLSITDGAAPAPEARPGQMTFLESIHVLDCMPRDLGLDQTIIFWNDAPRFAYRPPEDFLDLHSLIVCCSNNFAHVTQPPPEGLLRMTSIARYERWAALGRPEPYTALKEEWHEKQVAAALTFLPDFRPRVVFTDVFTPTTIHHYTRHCNGAVYGAPVKAKDGLTPVQGLFIIGTDQGFLGIVGSMLSGISIANARVLMGAPGA